MKWNRKIIPVKFDHSRKYYDRENCPKFCEGIFPVSPGSKLVSFLYLPKEINPRLAPSSLEVYIYDELNSKSRTRKFLKHYPMYMHEISEISVK